MAVRSPIRKTSPSLVLLAGAALVATACGGSGLQVMRDQQRLKEEVNQAGSRRARECAPIEYAKAQANLAFAIVEMNEGDPVRAREHLLLGEENVLAALKKIDQCQPPADTGPKTPPPPKDTDGDGIADNVDACPDKPEDFDGVEDEDGCPEGPRDRDGDGIVDSLDRCPDQPEDKDGVEDEDGCPDETKDRDGDGIADAVDRCPDQPEDKDGFQDDDGCPDVDNDGDGIFDVVDKCANEAEDFDGFEDQDGCPDPDNDRDGIVDGVDKCPTEPETKNGFEDEDGCPDTKPELPSRVTITNEQIKISEQIKFQFNSDVILKESFGILNDVAKVLKAYPRIKIRIEGHTDNKGTELYNLNLSKRRAASVLKYLIKAGIEPGRLTSVGLGMSQPIDTNKTEKGRANNRRVEFHITEQ
jgi:outer membrane protein OmpA-like peptidoglycan-associated protein